MRRVELDVESSSAQALWTFTDNTNSHVLVSSYLSHARVLPLGTEGSALYTLPLPTSLGATSCTWVSPAEVTSDILVAAGGVDRVVHVFSLPSLDPDVAASEGSTAREVYTLMGHSGPISNVIASSSGRDIISSSWDGALHLYALPEEEPTEHMLPADPTSYLPGQKKRRKIEGDAQRIIEGLTDGDATGDKGQGWRRAPDAVFRGHAGRIGGAVWDREDETRVWSAGWDGSIRGWDAESGANVLVRVSTPGVIVPRCSSINSHTLIPQPLAECFHGEPTLTIRSKDLATRLSSVWTSLAPRARSPQARWTAPSRSGTRARPRRSLRRRSTSARPCRRSRATRPPTLLWPRRRTPARARSGTCGRPSTPCSRSSASATRAAAPSPRTARCSASVSSLPPGTARCSSPAARMARSASGTLVASRPCSSSKRCVLLKCSHSVCRAPPLVLNYT